MDPIQLLKKDHAKVQKLFKEYSELGDKALKQKHQLAAKIFEELEIHTQIEEEILYPAVQAAPKAPDKAKKLVFEAFEEHKIVKTLIQEMKHAASIDKVFDAKMKVMRENVKHHIEEEHEDLFPKVKKAFTKPELDELGEQLAARKEQLLAA